MRIIILTLLFSFPGLATSFAQVDETVVKSFKPDSIPFAPAVNYMAGNSPYSVFCADLDGDFDLDLAVANTYSDNVSILKNNGDGTFLGAVDYGAGDGPRSVFCADLDGDGDLDLAVVNEGSDNVSILKNNGNGTFQSAVNYATGDKPVSFFCADLDGDDDLELAVTNTESDNISILKNNGNGTFQSAVNYATGDGPASVFCADLDGDLDLDLAVANAGSDSVSILKNSGNGIFQSAVNYATGDGPASLFCADLDGDMHLDLAVANTNSDNVSILKNIGDGTFQNAVNYEAGDGPHSVFCADLNGDFHLDLAVADVNAWGKSVSILKNQGDGTFQGAIKYRAGDGGVCVFCADLDGDGDFDLAVANIFSNNGISILKNLTEIPANQPPWAFNLFFPCAGDTAFHLVNFDWQSAYDPNFGDQERYDLYVSTSSGFEPQNTTIDSNLAKSRHSDSLVEIGTYYWKVKAKDNWGAFEWSDQTCKFFNGGYLTDTLVCVAFSPVDLILTDPKGDSIGLGFNTIPGATYDTTLDYNHDGDKDDIATLPNRFVGNYLIRVFPEPMGKGLYSLGIRIDGGAMETLAKGYRFISPEEVDSFHYYAPWYKVGDVNSDWRINLGDIVYLINYLYKNGPAPDPIERSDVTCDSLVDLGDLMYIINYLYKAGPPPSC
jgi:hypothetical protein